VRAKRLPLPLLGMVPLGYLTDLISTRDMWMHRLDICRATGREMVLTSRHNGRITALDNTHVPYLSSSSSKE
jgi:hypothetical protein